MQSLEPVLGDKLPLMLHNTREPSRMHTLLRWLFIGRAVEEKTASRFIPGEVLQLIEKRDRLNFDTAVQAVRDLRPCRAMLA